jgi:Protein of unknown function (DUF3293)
MEAKTLSPAYEQAIYKTPRVSFTLSEEKTDVILFDGRSYGVITAHNPHSEPLSQEENDRRHEALRKQLQEQAFSFDPSTGESPDGSWREEGFVIFDLELDTALKIGLEFGQHAILYGQGNRVALAWCESEKLDWFYPEVLQEGRI